MPSVAQNTEATADNAPFFINNFRIVDTRDCHVHGSRDRGWKIILQPFLVRFTALPLGFNVIKSRLVNLATQTARSLLTQ